MVAGRPLQRPLTFLFMTFLCLDALCVPTNVTIDDQTGDEVTSLKPVYSPAKEWQGFNCTDFNDADDPCSALDRTWHNATASSLLEEPPSFTIQFNGTAIWIFNIVEVGTFASLSFTLDGEDATLVAQGLDAFGTEDSDFQYNQTVFTKEGLEQGFHTVVGTVLFSDGPFLFDYAVYMTDLDSPPPNSTISSSSSLKSSIMQPVTQSPSAISLSFLVSPTSTITLTASAPTNPTLSPSRSSILTASTSLTSLLTVASSTALSPTSSPTSASPSFVPSATTPSSASSHSQRVKIIAGSVTAAAVATAVSALAFLLWRRRRIASSRHTFHLKNPGTISPFTDHFDENRRHDNMRTRLVHPYHRHDDSLSIDMTEILDRGSGPSASPAVLSPPSFDLPSVLDIHAGTRTVTTGAAASPRSSVSGIMSSLRREEALQEIADRAGLDMKSAGRRKVVVRRPARPGTGITQPNTETTSVVPFVERRLRPL